MFSWSTRGEEGALSLSVGITNINVVMLIVGVALLANGPEQMPDKKRKKEEVSEMNRPRKRSPV